MRGKIYIIGDIGKFEDSKKWVELADIVAQVRKQPDATEFDVYIDSGGGYVDVGKDIRNYLESLNKPLHTIGMNIVASMATELHLMGITRQVRPNTKYMIHLPSGGAEGTADEIAEYAKNTKAVEKRMLDYYVQRTGNTAEAIEPMLRSETWLTPEQLFDLGFITEMPMQLAAKLNINSNPNKMSKSKAESILEKLTALLSGEKVKSKTVFTSDQKELVFAEVEDEAMIQVGDTATLDGSTPPERVVLADGRTIVFDGNAVKEIIEKEDELDEQLAAKQAELDEALQKLEDLQAKYDEVQAKHDELKAENEANKKIVAKVEALKSEFQAVVKKQAPRNPEEEPRVSRFKKALTNMKKEKNK